MVTLHTGGWRAPCSPAKRPPSGSTHGPAHTIWGGIKLLCFTGCSARFSVSPDYFSGCTVGFTGGTACFISWTAYRGGGGILHGEFFARENFAPGLFRTVA